MLHQSWEQTAQAVRAHFAHQIAVEQDEGERRRKHMIGRLVPLIEQAKKQGMCSRAWLFGSYAWGVPQESSDVDIMIDGDAVAVSQLLSDHLRCDLHVLELEKSSSSLQRRVLTEGTTL